MPAEPLDECSAARSKIAIIFIYLKFSSPFPTPAAAKRQIRSDAFPKATGAAPQGFKSPGVWFLRRFTSFTL